MPANPPTTEALFDAWRRGDAQAGQAMAQRFTDWFFALAAIHSGEAQSRQGFRAACERFSQGVAAVPDPRRLGPWAQNVAKELIQAGRPRLDDGDFTGAYTDQRAPKALLAEARVALPDEMGLLETAYRSSGSASAFRTGRLVASPTKILAARYRVKKWLAAEAGVPFRVLPDSLDPDLSPLPVYESATMANDREYQRFELFLLEEPDLVQDVAEFAHYAIALRGGIDGAAAASAAAGPRAVITPAGRATTPPASPASPRPTTAPGTSPGTSAPAPAAKSGTNLVPVLLGAVVLLGLAVLALGAMLFTGG